MKKKAGRNRNGTGSIRFRKDRKARPYEIRYSVTDPLTLRSIQKSEYFEKEEDAERALLARAASVKDGSYKEPDKQTLNVWLENYLNEFSVVQASTKETYRTLMRKHIAPTIGSVRLCDLNRERLQRFTNSLYGALQPSSVKIVMAFISAALRRAKLFGYIPENYAQDLQYRQAEKKELPALTDAQAADLEKAAGSAPIGDMIFIALRTGMRKSEVLGMQWKNIDFKAGTLKVFQLSRDIPGQDRTIKKPKNKEARTIVLIPAVVDRLISIQKRQRTARLAAGSSWSNQLDLVFTNEIGQPILQSSVDHFFRKVRDAAGLPADITFHSLRRTFVTKMERAGIGGKALTSQVGHKSIAFTQDVYMRFTEDMQQDLRNQMKDAFSS